MKKRIRIFIKSDFFNSSLYSAVATLIRIVTAFLMSKIIAAYLGAEGLGIIGQLTNFVTIILIVAGGSVNTGITKYVAEFAATNVARLNQFISTAWWFILAMAFITAIILGSFASALAQFILHSKLYSPVFYLFAGTLLLYSLNGFFFALIIGYKNFRLYNLLNITSSIISLIVSYILIRLYSLQGALYAIVLQQSLVFAVTVFFIRKIHLAEVKNLRLGVKRADLMLLGKFILITIAANGFFPLCQMLIRNMIMQNISLKAAGLWETVNRISTMHLLFYLTTLSTYYLPRLSEINNKKLLSYEIIRTLKICIPVICFSAFLIYVLRFFIVRLLFTDEFTEAENLFAWQMPGDVFKVVGWIISYQMLAKAMVKKFMLTEFVIAFIYYIFSFILLPVYGIKGASIAYACSYLIYLIVVIIMFRENFEPLFKKDQNTVYLQR